MKKRTLKSIISIILVIALLFSPKVCKKEVVADTSLISSIYLKQAESDTCTLCAATMMLRARMYLSGNSLWSSITESAVKSKAWVSTGLLWSWQYSISGNTMSVAHESTSGLSVSKLKTLLNSHPEGIVIYDGGKLPHAVFVTDYVGDTFYCADPAGGYSGSRRALASSSLGTRRGSQANVLSNITAYWYISTYSIKQNVQEAVSGTPQITTDKNAYEIGETVTLKRNTVENTNFYWIVVWYKDEQILSTKMSDTTYVLNDLNAGTYRVYLQVGNSTSGTVTSEAYTFYVVKPIVDKPAITSEKDNYFVGETVTLERNTVENTNFYWIVLYKDGKQILSTTLTDSIYELNNLAAGSYHVFLQVGNAVSGTITSEKYAFSVQNKNNLGQNDESKIVIQKETDVKKPKIKKATKKASSTTAKIKLKKVKGVTGYQVKISITKKFKKSKTIKKNSAKTTIKVKKLKAYKKYYVKARCYKVVNGIKHYSKWTSTKKIKMK